MPNGVVEMTRFAELIIGAYNEADNDRRRTERSAKMMAVELEEANAALEQSVADLRSQNLRFTVALDNMANGFALFDSDGRLVVCNRRQRELLALQETDAPSGATLECFLRASHLLSESSIQQRLALAAMRVEVDVQQTLADEREVRLIVRPTADGGFLTSCEDVTERTRAAARIAFLAYHDALTGLPNRSCFREKLEQGLQCGVCTVLCLDLDGFKAVNDTLGHAAGDTLLRAVAERLRRVVRIDEANLARLGGDEFAAMIAGDVADAAVVAGRMIKAVGAPFEIEGQVVRIGTSIGIAGAPDDGLTAGELLRHADVALYRAKADGRRCFRAFEPGMGVATETRRSLEQDLGTALAGQQFELYYQSKVSVADGRTTGYEALLRWHHPERGITPPDVFIPIAEENGLIVPIGEWVLREACRAASRWPVALDVAVNVSTRQLRGSYLYEVVVAALQDSGLPSDRLELEVTETAMLSDCAEALETLRRLRAIGVRIALDDFGTGYSSLTYLQNFPLDRIKIDRSFIKNLNEEVKSRAIVRAVTGLGNSLGIQVTAEGVETQEQFDILAAENCNEVQGYLFSRPAPAADVQRQLELLMASQAA